MGERIVHQGGEVLILAFRHPALEGHPDDGDGHFGDLDAGHYFVP